MNGRILVVESDLTTRELFAGHLTEAGYRVFCAGDVPGAQALVREVRPDLALLDWWLPEALGLASVRQMSIIAVSARSEERDRIAALEGGADDYITKPFSMPELLARIKAVMRRRTRQLADEAVDVIGLCDTELRMLQLFMTHPGRIFDRAQLLEEVWGGNVFIEDSAIDVHVRRLRRALAANGHDVLIETVRGIGYCLRAERAPARHAPATDQAGVRGF